MIVGKKILDEKLVKKANSSQLKNSTLDLTIGDIIPIGKEGLSKRRSATGIENYVIEPREMVWILSREEFNLSGKVTGVATLRTTFTQRGMLALNVGIIDPFFTGPISTALLNFSDVPREISVGESFFRVLFFEHDDVSNSHRRDESRDRKQYLVELETQSLSNSFPKNFLNIPKLDDKYYADIFGKLVWAWISNHLYISFLGGIVFLTFAVYVWQDGYGKMLLDFLKQFKSVKP